MDFAEQLPGTNEQCDFTYPAEAEVMYGQQLTETQAGEVRFAALVVARQQQQEAQATAMTPELEGPTAGESAKNGAVTDVKIAEAMAEEYANPSLRGSYTKAFLGLVVLLGIPYLAYHEQINEAWRHTIDRLTELNDSNGRFPARPVVPTVRPTTGPTSVIKLSLLPTSEVYVEVRS